MSDNREIDAIVRLASLVRTLAYRTVHEIGTGDANRICQECDDLVTALAPRQQPPTDDCAARFNRLVQDIQAYEFEHSSADPCLKSANIVLNGRTFRLQQVAGPPQFNLVPSPSRCLAARHCASTMLTPVSYGDGRPYWRCSNGHVFPPPPSPDLATIDEADADD